MNGKLSWLDRRHNAKARKLIAALEEDIRARQAKGEVITEIVLPNSMEKKLAIIELVPAEEAIKEAEEEQKWRRCCK